MAKDNYVVIALFIFDNGFPVFNTLIGVTNFSNTAFEMIDNYDYKKVIEANHNMDIAEIGKPIKEFGTWKHTGKAYYEERHKFMYQVEGDEEKRTVSVTFSIYEA